MTEEKRTEENKEFLRVPTASLVLKNDETGEIIAIKGWWRRLPMENEILRVEYVRDNPGPTYPEGGIKQDE